MSVPPCPAPVEGAVVDGSGDSGGSVASRVGVSVGVSVVGVSVGVGGRVMAVVGSTGSVVSPLAPSVGTTPVVEDVGRVIAVVGSTGALVWPAPEVGSVTTSDGVGTDVGTAVGTSVTTGDAVVVGDGALVTGALASVVEAAGVVG